MHVDGSVLYMMAPTPLVSVDPVSFEICGVNLEAQHLLQLEPEQLEHSGVRKLYFTRYILSGLTSFIKWVAQECSENCKITLRQPETDQIFICDLQGKIVSHGLQQTLLIAINRLSDKDDLDVQRFFEKLPMAMLTVNRGGQIQRTNKACQRLSGYDAEELRLRHISALIKRDDWVDIIRGLSSDTATVYAKLSCNLVTSGGDDVYGQVLLINTVSTGLASSGPVLLMIDDISEIKQRESSLSNQAYTDVVTGIYNRTYFNHVFSEKMAEARRVGRQLVLFFIDLDGFKAVNDEYGHDEGDLLLRQIAERLKNQVRSTDIVARIGGDEFVILIDDDISLASIDKIGRNVTAALKQPYRLVNVSLTSGCSIGVARYPHDGLSEEELLKKADDAMYRVKVKGGDGVLLSE